MAEKSEQKTEQTSEQGSEQKSPDVKVIRIEGATMAGVTAEFAGPDQVGTAVSEMFATAGEKIAAAGGTPGTGISVYDMDPEHPEDGVTFTVGHLYEDGPVEGLQLVDLPTTEAAVLAHHGSMDTIGESWQALEAWVEEQEEWVASGPSREVYLQAGVDLPQEEWVTHLQQPVQPAVVAEGEHRQEDAMEVSDPDPNAAGAGASDDGEETTADTDEKGQADEGERQSSEPTADDSHDSEAEEQPGAENDAEDAPKVSEPGA